VGVVIHPVAVLLAAAGDHRPVVAAVTVHLEVSHRAVSHLVDPGVRPRVLPEHRLEHRPATVPRAARPRMVRRAPRLAMVRPRVRPLATVRPLANLAARRRTAHPEHLPVVGSPLAMRRPVYLRGSPACRQGNLACRRGRLDMDLLAVCRRALHLLVVDTGLPARAATVRPEPSRHPAVVSAVPPATVRLGAAASGLLAASDHPAVDHTDSAVPTLHPGFHPPPPARAAPGRRWRR
jgi:hypothetical protein